MVHGLWSTFPIFTSMKKLLLSVFCLVGLLTSAKSQHCGWDGCSIIVVEIVDAETGKIINGLDVRLYDSMSKPYTSEWNLRNHQNSHLYQNTDTLKFGQNLADSTEEFDHYKGPFSFGPGCYMLLVYYNNYPEFNQNGKDRIVIRDFSGKYETVSMPFSAENIEHLCTSNPIWRDKKALDRVKVTIKMRKKKEMPGK